jgi:uncharacterized protein (TIGR02217 family)
MTIPIFPSLPGLAFPLDRAPQWSTVLQKSSSGKKSGLMLYSFPEYQWTLDVEVLRQFASYIEFTELMGFINTVAGQGNVFYFTDPDDCSVTNQPNGTGDGATTAFQLVRSLGGFAEPIQSINGTPTLYLNGTATGAFSLGATGIVTFSSAPGAGVALSWTGNYYWLCRLDSDNGVKFSKFANGRWAVKQISFTSEKQ